MVIRVLFDKIASVFEKYINILALEMASPGNRHCVNCIGALLFFALLTYFSFSEFCSVDQLSVSLGPMQVGGWRYMKKLRESAALRHC